jgi:hypothetical protein
VEGLRFGHGEGKQKSLRGWIVLLVVLPPAFLGVAYFLFVESAVQDSGPIDPNLQLTLRLGGIGLVILALVLAAAFGYLLVDRVTRPLRLLLRLAESGDLASSRPLFERERGPEVLELFRLVSMLVNQNKAGARGLEELERLRAALARLREDVGRTGQHGIPPVVTLNGEAPLGEIGASLQGKRVQLLSFFHELRERVLSLRDEVSGLGQALGFRVPGQDDPASPALEPDPAPSFIELAEDEPGGTVPGPERMPGDRMEEVRASVQRVRQVGTVLVLEASRAGGEAERLWPLVERFRAGLGNLEETLDLMVSSPAAPVGIGPKATPAAAEIVEPARAEPSGEGRWLHLLEGLDILERLLGEVEDR